MTHPSPRRFERLAQLDELIRSKRAPSVSCLAKALEKSHRTINNDIDFLRDRLGAPLEYNHKQGWHYLDPEWRLTLVPLTQGELFALVLGSRMLEAAAGGAYSQELQSAIDQLVRRMPEQTWVDLQAIIEERIQFGAGALVDLNPDYLRILMEASRNQATVEMTYYTASRNAVSIRRLDPYVLYIYRGTNPYIIGYCHQRAAILYFRVDRIRSLRTTGEFFTRDPNFNARSYLQSVFQVEAGDKPVEVMIHFAAKVAPYIRERRWHQSQKIIEHEDQSLSLQMTVPGLAEIKRWVMSYGADATIKQPPELVEMICVELERMQSSYAFLLKRDDPHATT